jgi:hypothetical protein
MHRRRSGILYLVTIALMVAATWSLPGSAAAQGDTVQLTVGGILCQDADCIDHSNLIASFTISALDSASGDVLASCITDAADPHICTLEIPTDADYTLAWDDAQVPEGYEWRGDLYPVADGPFGSATLIPFVPDQATEVPTDVPTEAPTVIAEPGHVTIQVALCTDATCGTFAELLDDFTLSAINPDTGEVYSSCTTDNAQQGLDHQCILDVPGEGAWDITWDDSQVPAGYAYFGQPITSGEPSMMTIAFVPTAEPTQTPTIAPTQAASVTPTQAAVTALPSTGAGPHDGATPWTALLVVIAAALLAAAVGLTGLHRTAFATIRRHDDR